MNLSTKVYDQYKGLLWGLSYRMTGNAAEADDIVQETFVRVLENPPAGPCNEWKPWLTRVASNLCIDYLRRRKKTYPGSWLPSPVATRTSPGVAEQASATKDLPSSRYEMQESISMAFLISLEALSPSQRAVLLLRDVFDLSTREAAHALEMTETTVKVTLHRARNIMRNYKRKARWKAPPEHMRRILKRFLHLLKAQDAEGLKNLLAKDVVLVSDGGGEVTALAVPVKGRENVLRLIIRLNEVYRSQTHSCLHILNAAPAVLFDRTNVRPGHAARFTMHCELNSRRKIERFHFVFAPKKLTALGRAIPAADWNDGTPTQKSKDAVKEEQTS